MRKTRRSGDYKKGGFIYAAFAVAALILLVTVLAMPAKAAPDLSDVFVEVGTYQTIYTEDSNAEWGFKLNSGTEGFPIYATVGWDQPRVKMLGQPVADTEIFSFGFGAKKAFGDLSLFTEAGWAWVDPDINKDVREEIVYTQLLLNHNVEGRSPPFGSRMSEYQTSYKMDDAPFLRVGIDYRVHEHAKVFASYRVLYSPTEMTARSSDWQEGQGYWREDETYNLSAFEVGVLLTF